MNKIEHAMENKGILDYPWSEDEIQAWKKLLQPDKPSQWERIRQKLYKH